VERQRKAVNVGIGTGDSNEERSQLLICIGTSVALLVI